MATTNIITVLCEGPHDVAFLTKILKSNGYKSNDNKKIGEYPVPYNSLLENEAKKSDINGLNIQELRSVMLPTSTLINKNSQLFLYAVGGDTRKDKRQKLLAEINSFIAKSEEEYEILPEDTKMTVLYFFDADEKGEKVRFDEVVSEIKEIFDDFDDSDFDKKPVSLFEDKLAFGAYIFKKKGKDKGKLEDILLPLMKNGNDKIFEEAEIFIETHYDAKRAKGKRFNKEKSVIGTVGQLQKSGSSNVVCIGQTDYLTDEKILADKQCIDIANFFKQFL